MQAQHSTAALAGASLPFIYMPISAVKAAVGLSSSAIYQRISKGDFPAGDLIGDQSRRWKSTDISAWLLDQSAKAERRREELAAPLKAKADRAAKKSAQARADRAVQASRLA